MDRRLRAKALSISAREKEQRKISEGFYEEGMRVGTAEEIPWTGWDGSRFAVDNVQITAAARKKVVVILTFS